MKDVVRRANKLRRRVYREIPVASANRTADLDHRMCYAEMAAILASARLGVSSGGAALALWRACSERGLRAWCYEFGLPDSATRTVTVVDVGGVLQIHDAFFNLSYPSGLYDVLGLLRNGEWPRVKREVRDKKVYIMDPARESGTAARWLQEHAERELEPVDGLRRFELLWGPEGLTATDPGVDSTLSALTARGYPTDLQYAMLHPVAVFDGARWHRNRAEMPLLRGCNLESPVAALGSVSRELELQRTRFAEASAAAARLEGDLVEAKKQASAVARRFSAERETLLQQRAALLASNTALKSELAEVRNRLSSAVDLRAQRDSQIAQLRAEIEDGACQLESQRDALEALRGLQREWEAARHRLEKEIHDVRTQLDLRSRENELLGQSAGVLATRAEAADEQVIAITHSFPPLFDELRRLRSERDAMSREMAMLEAQISGSLGARLRSLWRRLTLKREAL